MRLFVAADIDERTRAQIGPVREAIQRVLDRAPAVPRVTWVKDEAAHVTLRFIGEVPADTGQLVQQAMQQPLAVEAFDVQWDRLGAFPGGRHPRVVWIGGSRGGDQFAALARAVDARLAAIVGPAESRPFKAHVTIGRVKEPGQGADWAQAMAAAAFAPTVTRIDHATLYLSRTSPNGPTYTALCRTKFVPDFNV